MDDLSQYESQSVTDLLPALLKARQSFPTVPRSGTGHAGRNGERSYGYATLTDIISAVEAPLLEAGLLLSQTERAAGTETTVLETRLRHTSGQWISNRTPVMAGDSPTPQQYGSALTYARRYGLSALLCIVTEDDDDGASASAGDRSRPSSSNAHAITENQAARAIAIARKRGNAFGRHGFAVIGSLLKQAGLATPPDRARMGDMVQHLAKTIPADRYDGFCAALEDWEPSKPKAEAAPEPAPPPSDEGASEADKQFTDTGYEPPPMGDDDAPPY